MLHCIDTLKCLAAKSSLDQPFMNKITVQHRLLILANSNIEGIKFIWVSFYMNEKVWNSQERSSQQSLQNSSKSFILNLLLTGPFMLGYFYVQKFWKACCYNTKVCKQLILVLLPLQADLSMLEVFPAHPQKAFFFCEVHSPFRPWSSNCLSFPLLSSIFHCYITPVTFRHIFRAWQLRTTYHEWTFVQALEWLVGCKQSRGGRGNISSPCHVNHVLGLWTTWTA